MKKLMEELRVKIEGSMKLFCDYKSAICMAKDPVHHGRTTHIKLDRNLTKKIENKTIELLYVSSTQRISNTFTKTSTKASFGTMNTKLA